MAGKLSLNCAESEFIGEENKKDHKEIGLEMKTLDVTGISKSSFANIRERKLRKLRAPSPAPRLTQPVRSTVLHALGACGHASWPGAEAAWRA